MIPSDRVLIIAEAGVNHNGSLDNALALIDAASMAGADVVKFQTFDSGLLSTETAPQAEYQIENIGCSQSQREMLKSLELPIEFYPQLISYCSDRGIEFLSTGFDLQSIDHLSSLNLKRWKIPSGEITNLPYLRKIGSFQLPVILSTGMATLGEVEKALYVLEMSGIRRSLITLLHCTSEYPAPVKSVNLLAMNSMGNAFHVNVGYSDHTNGIEVPLAAVALGAIVIEKHLTLDKSMPGPDHLASLEPSEFSSMVKAIRIVESSLGDGIKRPTNNELLNSLVVRKSLVAACDIQMGETFTETNLTVKRPGSGISPMFWDAFIGKTADRDYVMDEIIE